MTKDTNEPRSEYMDFKVIQGASLAEVKKKVNRLLGKGWKRKGGVLTDLECKGVWYSQCVAKEWKE